MRSLRRELQPAHRICLVSPFEPLLLCPLCEDDGWEQVGDSHVAAYQADRVPGKPSDIIVEEDASVIQPGEGMPESYVPTAAQVAQHSLTHLPYRSWCKWCVMARRPNSQHRSKHPSFQRNTPSHVCVHVCIEREDMHVDIHIYADVHACICVCKCLRIL